MKTTALLAAALSLAASSAALAHHSFASFDMENQIRIDGMVVEVQWTNPHAWMEVDVVAPPDGAIERWSVEFNSPNNLSRQGWKRDTIEAGDLVTFYISPLRDGRKAGLFYSVTLENGEVIRDPMAQAAFEREQAAAADSESQ